LQYTQITSLPASIGNITNLVSLKFLELNNSEVTILPDFLENLPALVKIEIVDCAVKTIPPSIQRLVDSGELTLIKTEDEFIDSQHRRLKRNKPGRS